MEYFGVFAFVMVVVLMGKVSRLERILRDNGLRPGGTTGVGEQVRKQVGRTVELTVEGGDFDVYGKRGLGSGAGQRGEEKRVREADPAGQRETD